MICEFAPGEGRYSEDGTSLSAIASSISLTTTFQVFSRRNALQHHAMADWIFKLVLGASYGQRGSEAHTCTAMTERDICGVLIHVVAVSGKHLLMANSAGPLLCPSSRGRLILLGKPTSGEADTGSRYSRIDQWPMVTSCKG
jgi:hypothetical protein